MEMESEAAGRKRERRTETETAQAGRKKGPPPPPGKLSAEIPSVLDLLKRERMEIRQQMDALRLKRAVERRNQENPGADPIVAEALTAEQRAALVQEEKDRDKAATREYSLQRLAELERAQPRPQPRPPNPNQDELNYNGYRRIWNTKWSELYGSFEDITRIPAMCFTDNPMPCITCHPSTLQVSSVKVAGISGGLQWPIHVFGMMAMRDDLDHNRNIIFSRSRDNCQTLTQQDPRLILTGPARAVVHEYGSVYFEALLKVKGNTESEDKDLSLLIKRSKDRELPKSSATSITFTSKLSTLELECGLVVSSTEATIAVHVMEGSWPDGLRCQFTACNTSVPDMKVLLLDSGEEKVASLDGTVELSRRVVSVESFGRLNVSAVVFRGGDQVVEVEMSFAPLEAGRSHGVFDVGFCKLQVTVAWSPFLICYPAPGFSLAKAGGSSGEVGSSRS